MLCMGVIHLIDSKLRNFAKNQNLLQISQKHGNNFTCFVLLSKDHNNNNMKLIGVRDYERNYN